MIISAPSSKEGSPHGEENRVKKRRIFYGWWIVGAGSAITFYVAGVFYYGFGAFFDPIKDHFGWSRAVVSGAMSMQRLEGGIAAPIVGFIFDRIGPRKLMLFGVACSGLGFIAFSRINSIWSYYLAFFIISLAFSCAGGAVSMATIVNWFIKMRSRALTIFFVGSGLSGAAAPVVVWLINSIGWRDTLFFIGIGTWVICFPLALVMRHRPEQYGLLPDGETPEAKVSAEEESNPTVEPPLEGARPPEINFTAREALRTRAFWFIALAYSFQVLVTGSVIVHLITYLKEVDISRGTAGFALAAIPLLSLVGRVVFGWLGDIRDKRHLLAINFGLQGIGVLILAYVTSPWHLIPFLIVFAPAYGGPLPLRPAILGEYFGRTYFGTIQGLMMSISVIGAMIGPILAGWISDTTDSYRLAFWLFAILSLASIPAILAAKRPTLKRDDQAVSPG